MNLPDLIQRLELESKGFQQGIGSAMGSLDALNTKGGKSQSLFGSLGKVLGGTAAAGLGAFGLAAGATGTAVLGVGVALGSMATKAAGVPGLTSAFDNLAQQAGTTGDAMLKAMQEGSGGTINATDLMTQFNKASSLVSAEFASELPDAMALVSKASVATGQDMGFLMDSLVTGVGRVSPMILDNLGVQVSLTEATEAYAKSNGLVASELTKTQQQYAVQKLVMGKLEEKYGEMDSVYDTASSKLAAMKASFGDLTSELGVAFLPVLMTLLETLMPLIQTAFVPLVGIVNALVPPFQMLIGAVQPVIELFSKFGEKLAIVMDSLLGGDATTAIAVFTGAITQLGAGLQETLPTMIETGVGFIMNLVDGMVQALPSLFEVATQILVTILETLTPMLPEMMMIGLELILNVITGILDAIPQLIPVVIEIITTLITTLVDNLPQLITTGMEAIHAFIEGMIEIYPDILTAGIELIGEVITGILSMLPEILTTGVELVMSLISGLVEMLPELLATGLDLIVQLAAKILTMLPEILSTGIDLLMELINGIISVAPELLTTAITLIGDFVSSILTMLPELISSGVELLLALIDGLLNALPDLIAMVPDIIVTIVTTLTTLLPDIITAGIEILVALIEGLGEAIPQLIAAIPAIITAIVESFGEHDWGEIGRGIIEGIATAITGGASKILEAARDAAKKALDAVKSFLGIGSPSKAFMRIGEYINEGWVKGIVGTQEKVERAVTSIGDSLIKNATPKMDQFQKYIAGKLKTDMSDLIVPERDISFDVNKYFNGENGWGEQIKNYYLSANYPQESALSLTDRIKVLEALG